MSSGTAPGAVAPTLRAEGLSKRFGAVTALHDVSLELQPGEIHAVVGENGAGKSTLMRLLAGVYAPDEGTVVLHGRPVHLRSPQAARRLGIGIVHQELSLCPNLDVAENILADRQPTNALGLVRRGELRRRAQELLDRFGLRFSPDTPVAALAAADRQATEILKALSHDPEVLILDEPTSSLARHEIERLFGLLRELAERRLGLLYISHHLEEVFALSHRVTVLRDGQLVGTRPTAETSPDEIVALMVGRALALHQRLGRVGRASSQQSLQVRDLRSRAGLGPVSLDVAAGEIVGVAGLVGAGRTRLAQTLFGVEPAVSGEVLFANRPARAGSPQAAVRRGFAYLSEDRKEQGLFLDMAVPANIAAVSLAACSRWGFVSDRRTRELAARYVEELGIDVASLDQPVRQLSGGNQQKVLLAMWLAAQPSLLILDEPTRGIDVGAKAAIHDLLRRLAAGGMPILLMSSDLPEILSISDRVLVMRSGRIAGELPADEATEERVMALAAGVGGPADPSAPYEPGRSAAP